MSGRWAAEKQDIRTKLEGAMAQGGTLEQLCRGEAEATLPVWSSREKVPLSHHSPDQGTVVTHRLLQESSVYASGGAGKVWRALCLRAQLNTPCNRRYRIEEIDVAKSSSVTFLRVVGVCQTLGENHYPCGQKRKLPRCSV